ncbi:hypothetical protein AW168_21805 [Nocardia brasiliensis]|nr:hypothetical protein AW168_21805 [Nocardia brasiliensis]
MVGGGGFLLVGVMHGDLPDEDVTAAVRFVADHPHWYVTHLAGILCVLLWAGAFYGLPRTLRTALGCVLGRFAALSMGIGAAIFAVDSPSMGSPSSASPISGRPRPTPRRNGICSSPTRCSQCYMAR